MIATVLSGVGPEWARCIRRAAGGGVSVLQARSLEATVELLQSVPADLIVVGIEEFTQERLEALAGISSQAAEAVLTYVAPRAVIERFRREGIAEPGVWVPVEASTDDRDEALRTAFELARLRADMAALNAGPVAAPVEPDSGPVAEDIRAFHRLLGGLTGGFDLGRLLDAYVDAIAHFTRCAGYCLLWESAEGLQVRAQRGVPAEVVEGGRLSSCDALPTWYRRNRRVLTAAELATWPDRQQAGRMARELAIFGGQVALPLIVCGRLAGIMLLGEKVLGASYATGEIETLFAVTNYVALAAEGIELHDELRRAKTYTDRIVERMGAGMITLGADERIEVCNPYAAEVLGLDCTEVEGADLRALPSPLGDMLYDALRRPERPVMSAEVPIRGGEVTLRITTSALLDEGGEVLGSVMMLDDITAARELAHERSRREQLDVLNKIVGRIAHEVKNPLTAVKTYAELISARGSDERLAQFWSQTVLPEIDHLDEMIKNLLRMVEQPEPHVEPARPEDLVRDALAVLPMSDEVKHQSFDLQFAPNLPPVLVDPTATRDALSYLMRYLAGNRPYRVEIHVDVDRDTPGQVLVRMIRRSRTDGQFDPQTVFDPLCAIQDPESDLGPVISQKIIANQHGRVDAVCDEGRVAMLVALPGAMQKGAISEVTQREG